MLAENGYILAVPGPAKGICWLTASPTSTILPYRMGIVNYFRIQLIWSISHSIQEIASVLRGNSLLVSLVA
jgi:hypothetical protein